MCRTCFGNLTVLERGKYHGGYTVFPQFGIGVDARSGDFLSMDVHQWHSNTNKQLCWLDVNPQRTTYLHRVDPITKQPDTSCSSIITAKISSEEEIVNVNWNIDCSIGFASVSSRNDFYFHCKKL